jgi:hypothetical protein
VFTGGLALALGSPTLGAHFLTGLLEPFLRSCEALLAEHSAAGDLPEASEDEVRTAALGLVAPLLLALLHQDALDGSSVRRLDVEDVARRHAELVLAVCGLVRPDRTGLPPRVHVPVRCSSSGCDEACLPSEGRSRWRRSRCSAGTDARRPACACARLRRR